MGAMDNQEGGSKRSREYLTDIEKCEMEELTNTMETLGTLGGEAGAGGGKINSPSLPDE